MEQEIGQEAPLSEEEFGGRVFDNFFKLYFQPELERRSADGRIRLPADIAMGQVVFPEDGKPIIRFDEEVRIVARLSMPLTDITNADTGNLSSLDGVERLDLVDEELDYGHFTFLRLGEKIRMAFSFLYGRLTARKKIDRADEFLIAAKEAKNRGHTAVAFDNLFSATELLSRVHLEIHSNIKKGVKTHSSVASGINRWGKLGNVPEAFTAIFNKASNARDQARYRACSNDELILADEEFAVVDREIKLLRDQCSGLDRVASR
ncbi:MULTISPECIES: hypothetical protein [Mesorhizobium]|uniref:hypothetical protein n=1 Tax=Mesorhizobium TaxID=68287 RepID=UPI0003CE13B3|nr:MULTISPECIES: hypothetical protein [Mesorhizobium]ESY71123.1 hypothetical protein X742_00320 [Mesorhizobium sp. LNHC232B00]WJI41149.1 hypothetical protein NL534_13265 [Mesorhizobium opportunistum]